VIVAVFGPMTVTVMVATTGVLVEVAVLIKKVLVAVGAGASGCG